MSLYELYLRGTNWLYHVILVLQEPTISERSDSIPKNIGLVEHPSRDLVETFLPVVRFLHLGEINLYLTFFVSLYDLGVCDIHLESLRV